MPKFVIPMEKSTPIERGPPAPHAESVDLRTSKKYLSLCGLFVRQEAMGNPFFLFGWNGMDCSMFGRVRANPGHLWAG